MWRAEDTRLVQTAVLHRAGSNIPVNMPMDRQEALMFRRIHITHTFWCGTLLGGCGRELSARVYGDRVCHFAHHPSLKECARRRGGRDSADHLYAGRELSGWLNRQGQPYREPEYEGDFSSGGSCDRLFLPRSIDHPPLYVEFTSTLSESLRSVLESAQGKWADWLIRENPPLARELLEREGYALRIRFRDHGMERVFEVGTLTRDGLLRWHELDACSFTPNGIETPVLRDRRQLRLSREKPRRVSPRDGIPALPRTAPPSPNPEQLLRQARKAISTRNSARVERAIDLLVRKIPTVKEERTRTKLRRMLSVLQEERKDHQANKRVDELLLHLKRAIRLGDNQRVHALRAELQKLRNDSHITLWDGRRQRIDKACLVRKPDRKQSTGRYTPPGAVPFYEPQRPTKRKKRGNPNRKGSGESGVEDRAFIQELHERERRIREGRKNDG